MTIITMMAIFMLAIFILVLILKSEIDQLKEEVKELKIKTDVKKDIGKVVKSE